MLRLFLDELSQWVKVLVDLFPGRVGWRCRSCFVGTKAGHGKGLYVGRFVDIRGSVTFGENVRIFDNCRLSANDGGQITVGDNVDINPNVTVSASNGGLIIIGNNCLIAANTVLRASDHGFSRTDIPIREQAHQPGRIIMGEDVWIGANSVVLRDVTIGAHAIIGAGAVVKNDIPEWGIAVGVPAQVKRFRTKDPT
jgi:galactoside O-acetyltransferase